ncbi:hypothetical protein [Pseudonocardia endophytica]|uniref:Uncharacterized protein n=1 Tax=Pseudonocardia endophytica TaxID=401976 RepID=A0A4R1HJ61_PSEEN|nr:hypothetical protein [Pseudonocardia endophytica]TCK22364.1 hypothetical protein EV378_6366 [Pseudonocardia endophytica]
MSSIPRRVLAVLLVASAVLHVLNAVRGWPSVTAVILAVLALAAIVVAFVVPVRTKQADLLAAIVVGALGVLAFLVPTVIALGGGTAPGTVLDLRSVGGFLVDTVVVRLAAITLRREAKATTDSR